MIKILFVCHGNICRSPMAEFVMKDLVARQGLSEKFQIASSATSTEEIGHDIHRGTKRKLTEMGIPFEKRYAAQLKKSDYEYYDFIVVMDEHNLINICRIIYNDPKHKIFKLLDFTEQGGDIADPWYTGNFDKTFDDIKKGCEAFFNYILKNCMN